LLFSLSAAFAYFGNLFPLPMHLVRTYTDHKFHSFTKKQLIMATAQKNAPAQDAFAQANKKIIELLTSGTVPWDKPFTAAGIPRNIITRKQYRGINLLLLASLGYERNFFITQNQLADIDGSIKAKEKPHVVTFWNYPKEADAGKENGKNDGKSLLYYYVYNTAQCSWPMDTIKPEVMTETHTIAACEQIVENMPHCPQIRSKEKDATVYYDAIEDFINMPKQKTLKTNAEYYTSLFRQLVHSTGHHTRLDRMGLAQMKEYGYTGLSLEDLVADIGTWYLRSITGIVGNTEYDTLYIRLCIEKFTRDPRLIYTAATLAQQAVDFILNVQNDVEETAVVTEEMTVV
jgi:antirestriction protein ArdC